MKEHNFLFGLMLIVLPVMIYVVINLDLPTGSEHNECPTSIEEVQSVVLTLGTEPITTFYNTKYDMILDFKPSFKEFTYDFVDRKDLIFENTGKRYGSFKEWNIYRDGDTTRVLLVTWDISNEFINISNQFIK